MAGAITTSSGMVHHPMFEQLESELKIQQIAHDLVEAAHEYVKENIRLKDEVSTSSSKTALVSSGVDVDKFKSELVAERKSHLVALNEKDIKIWSLQKDQDEKRLALNGKDGEISSLKARLQIMQSDSEMAIANQPFSAGVMDVDCNEMLSELRSELEDEKAEHSVTKAYYRQVDDAYNQEAEEVAELMKQIQEKVENKMAGDSGKKSKDKTDPNRARLRNQDW